MTSRPLRNMERVPLIRWGILTFVAFAGSAFYGASLAHAIPGWQLWRGALWLTASAGIGWLALGPALIFFTRRSPFSLADDCLVAMAAGEGVLALGAIANITLRDFGLPPILFNGALVASSNVLMGSILAARLKRSGVAPRLTLLLWISALDGVGALAFWILYRVLFP